MRPAMLIWVESRAPLLPIGSLITCTISAWPSNTCFSIGTCACVLRTAAGGSPSGWRCQTSATCRKAARSSPISTKADCMPGNTLATLPR